MSERKKEKPTGNYRKREGDLQLGSNPKGNPPDSSEGKSSKGTHSQNLTSDSPKFNRLLALKAGAGSGKTFALAIRYISLLLQGTDPNEILAITFTNKATAEMEERIIKFLRLSRLPEEEQEAVIGELVRSSGLPREIVKEKLEGEELLKKVLEGRLRIWTIDSLLHRIVRKFGYRAGVEPSFTPVEGNPEEFIHPIIEKMEPQEQKYLIHYLQSNPTKGVKEFFQWLNILYGRYFEVYPILRKYTRQIEKKEVHRQVGVLKKEIEKILAQLEEMSGRGSLMTIVEKIVTGEEEGKLQKYFKRMGVLDSPQFRQLVFQYYRKQLEYEKLQEIMELGSLGRILESYQSLRIGEQKRVGEFGFTDIGVIAHQLLRGENSIDKEFFYFRLDSKFTHILIDEFQDTSLLQWEILEPLVDEIKAGEGTHPTSRSFFYVGDTNQAIYRWRGGEEKLFEAVCHRLRPYGLKKESLEKNYRSGKVLVNYFKEIFKVKQEGVKEGGYLEVKEFPDPEEIKGKVLEQIKNLLAKGVAPSQIAVLSRGNREVEEFYQLLKGEGIPVVTSTTKGRVVAHPKVEGILGAIRHLYLKEMGVEDSLNLAKFEGILGRKVEEGELPPLDLNSPPAPYIRHLLQKFELLDPITLQFWEISLNYPTFAHLYWNIEKDHTKLSEGELEGVNLMTIHASKGLEFDYLFLPDFLYSPPNSSTPLFFYGTGECSCERGGDCNLSLLEIRKRFSKNRNLTAKFDTHWQKIREEEERAKYREEWNSIYVAFTRAKRGLFVYYLHPKVRKGRAKSYFLTYLPQLKTEKRGKLEIVPPQEENISHIQWLNWEEYPHWGAQEHREKGEEEFIGDIGAIFKGRALHYSFEMGDIEAGRNWFGSYLNFDQLEELFARRWRELTSRLPGVWFRELPFLLEGREKRGDLIVVRPDGSLVIVDYKTSFQKSSLSKYRRQVREYLRGLEEITGTSKIEGWLFFTDTGEWHRVYK